MQHDLNHLTEWLTLNNIMLNASKMNFMLFSPKGNLSDTCHDTISKWTRN